MRKVISSKPDYLTKAGRFVRFRDRLCYHAQKSMAEEQNEIGGNSDWDVWWKWAVIVAVAVAIALWPRPDGVTREAWTLLAIFVATIAGSILRPIPAAGVVLLGVVALSVFGALPIKKALGGYAEPVVWLVLAAFFLSRGMVKTGLGRRIALMLISLLGKRTLGLGYALVLTDGLLASGVPSNGARAGGIVLPIARSVSETYNSRPGESAKKLGAFLMNLLYQCDVIICATFITGQASNLIIANLVQNESGIALNHVNWFTAAIVPGLCSLIAVPLMIYYFFPPEIKQTPAARTMAQDELEKMGPVKWQEIAMLVVFVVTILLWIFGEKHLGLETATVALLAVCALLLAQVLTWEDLVSETAAWEVFIWYGGLVQMAAMLGETGITKLFAQNVANFTTGWQWWTALALLALVYFYSHYAFASITAHVTAMLVPFLAVCLAVGAPAGLAVLALAYFSNLNAGLTHYGTTPAPIYFGAGYVTQQNWWTIGFIASIINIIIWSTVGLAWWKFLGWW
jgi:DASS family divalent anion:Na+ symporter